jgi:hypothetical protein
MARDHQTITQGRTFIERVSITGVQNGLLVMGKPCSAYHLVMSIILYMTEWLLTFSIVTIELKKFV